MMIQPNLMPIKNQLRPNPNKTSCLPIKKGLNGLNMLNNNKALLSYDDFQIITISSQVQA